MRVFDKYWIVVLLIPFHLFAQEKPKLYFIKDTVEIGKPIELSMQVEYNPEQEIYFPDSNWNYYPFEFISKSYFPTETKNSISKDRVVFTLRTFELVDKPQISLPVFYIDQGDTVMVYSDPIQLNLKKTLNTDSLSTNLMQSDVQYFELKKKINYTYWSVYSMLFILLLIGGYFIFGKSILRNYRLYVMHSNHITFLREFDHLMSEFSKIKNIKTIEKALSEWKNYMTKLENKPIMTYTSTEIINLYNNEDLKESLQLIDRSIYRGDIKDDPSPALSALYKFCNNRYKKIRSEIRK